MMINKTHEDKWVRLKGISGHGKNRIREHSDLWKIVHVDVNKVMLQSSHKTFKAGDEMFHDGRWINNGIDKNFEIIGVDV